MYRIIRLILDLSCLAIGASPAPGGAAAARRKLVDMVVIYFEDFLSRLCDYGFFHGVIPTKKSGSGDGSALALSAASKMPDLNAMNAEREAKIRRFKQSKDRKERLKAFEERRKAQKLIEEDERKYWMDSLEDWMNKALDDLNSLKEERLVL